MFDKSQKTEAVMAALRSANRDVSWEQLSGAAGCSLAELRQTIVNARRYLERDEGIVFETVRGVGLRRLSDAEKVESAKDFTRKIHRTAVRGENRIGAVHDMGKLSNEQQLAATLQQTVFRAIKREAGQVQR